ncbi:MAG: sporulation protein YqfD [Desulfotomaculales bacterium]
MFRLTSYLRGFVSLVLEGEALEKFFNMAASRGIPLWNLRRLNRRRAAVQVPLQAVWPLRHVARRTRTRFRIQKRTGLPFLLLGLRRRRMLAGGALVFVTVVYLLSSFVWSVEVVGHQSLDPQEILAVAREAGVRPGACRWRLRAAEVEGRIADRVPAVAWVGVHFKGTRAIIEVAEKKFPAPADVRPCHIVAAKSGLVKEVLVLRGTPRVAEGDVVEPGQVLISGEVPVAVSGPGAGQEQPPPRELRRVHAAGLVRARVWYRGYAEVPLVEEGERPSGRSALVMGLRIGNREVALLGKRNLGYLRYHEEKLVKRLPSWRNLDVPVELHIVRRHELVPWRTERSPAEAREMAVRKALEAALSGVPPLARILDQQVNEVPAGHPPGLVRVWAQVETLEDIGTEQYF